MKTSLDVYFSDPAHGRWEYHYGWYYGRSIAYLSFSPQWAAANLPPAFTRQSPGATLRVVLLDATDGGLYETRMPAFYEGDRAAFGPDWDDVPIRRLQEYMYADHHCACHRKIDARAAGALTDEECEGGRFRIERIESPLLPGLVLYSETMGPDELEAMLRAGRVPA